MLVGTVILKVLTLGMPGKSRPCLLRPSGHMPGNVLPRGQYRAFLQTGLATM